MFEWLRRGPIKWFTWLADPMTTGIPGIQDTPRKVDTLSWPLVGRVDG